MASEIYEIHVPTQVRPGRTTVFLFKRKKKTKPTLEYIWPEVKKPINGEDIDDVMKQIAKIIKDDCDNLG